MAGKATSINKRLMKVTIEGVEQNIVLTNARLVSAESDADTTTFADAAAGGSRQYNFAGTALQDPDADSIFELIWNHPGQEVDIVMKPFGNATPTVQQPHYTFTAIVKEPDGDMLGGDADASATAYMTIEFEWETTSRPVIVTA